MKLQLIAAILLVLGASFTTACGKTACDKAADITENDCGISPGTNSGTATEVDCTGDTEALAQCAVDNKDAYCSFLDDPLGAGTDNAYASCVADVNGG